MFVQIDIIQTLPPSNPNRDDNGNPKSVRFGGVLRARMSSQAQKRAARIWYRDNLDLNRKHLAQRSRRWDTLLAEKLTFGGDQKLIIARLLLNQFNVNADKLLDSCINPPGNLLFLALHEVETIAVIAERHQDLLLDLAERVEELRAFSEEGGKNKKRSYDRHPSDSELRLLTKDLKELAQAVPGDIAVFGRMMARLIETSVDGCVQVADAISVNAIGMSHTDRGKKVGEVDWYVAQDDIEAVRDDELEGGDGAAMLGYLPFTAPVYYRYANICVSELTRLVGEGNEETARDFAGAFIRGFIHSLPSGYIRAKAHMTLPEFVLIQVSPKQPYQQAPAFLSPINELGASGLSISQQAVAKLMERRNEMIRVYGGAPVYSQVVALSDHYVGGESLEDVIEQALTKALSADTTDLSAEM